MNRLAEKLRLLPVLLVLTLGASSCAKKEPKPLRTEPWLAHGALPGRTSADASANASDAALPITRYALSEPSRIHFEIPGKRGALRGSLTRVTGELSVVLADLPQSHGQVRADLASLAWDGPEPDASALARAKAALDVSDAGAGPSASFELSELVDPTPAQVEPAPESDAGTPFTRRVRLTAVGNLLFHGFRVVRRAPLQTEFSFASERQVPTTLMIQSRAPFVVSLETHAVRVLRPESERKNKNGAASPIDEVHVSVELYGRKVD